MEAREARAEFYKGRLSAERLLELVERQERLIRRLTDEVQRLRQRLARYEPEVALEAAPSKWVETADGAAAGATRYSLEAEEKRRRRKRKKKSPGRRPTHLKFADAQRLEDVYPRARPF